MRIAVIHWGYPPIIGGVETHLSQMCPLMVSMGHTVSLLTGAHPDTPERYDDRGVSVVRSPLFDLNWLTKRGLTHLEREVQDLVEQFLTETDAEVIHVHNMHYFSEMHTRVVERAAQKRGIPLVLTAHNVWDDSLHISLVRDIQWDAIISVSHYIEHALIGYGVSPQIVTTIHHGIEGQPFFSATAENAYRKYPQLHNKRVVFHPARMGKAKGNHFTIQAFRLIKEKIPDAFLVMAGTRNTIDWGETQQREIAYMLELLDLFGLRESTLIDQYALGDMPSMYAAAEVVVYPSIFAEPFGITMLEAMAAAKPIVVTRSGGMPEVIRHGVNGFVINQSDPRALARHVIRLLKCPNQARTIGAQGREIFQRQYYLERMVDQTLAVYQKCLQSKK